MRSTLAKQYQMLGFNQMGIGKSGLLKKNIGGGVARFFNRLGISSE